MSGTDSPAREGGTVESLTDVLCAKLEPTHSMSFAHQSKVTGRINQDSEYATTPS